MQKTQILIDKINSLPSLSPVIQHIISVVSNHDCSASDVVDAIKLDPAIAGKVLRLANSAYFGMPKTVSSLKNAVVILGQKTIHSLVISASLLSQIKGSRELPFDGIRFWKHSIAVAMTCESIAKHLLRYESIDPGEVFCAGILHDIGKLIIGVYSPDLIKIVYDQVHKNNTPYYLNEDQDTSHEILGALIAKKWNFPTSLINAIKFHHAPMRAEYFEKTVAIVHIADCMMHILGINLNKKEVPPIIDNQVIAIIGLKPERLRVIAQSAIDNEKRIESIIDFFSS